MLSDLGRDLQYALRTLLRAPTFAATVIATLALGIGANSIIFSAVNAVLLRDAPVADPGTLVDVYTSSGNNPYSNSSYPDYFDLRDSGTFASLAAYTPVSITMDANGQPEPLAGQLVSGNYFEALGVKVPFGRGLTPDDDRLGRPVRVAVISDALWQRVFNADRSLIGQTIRLNSNPYTLIGVAPPGFVGPLLGVAPDVWIPTALQPEVDPPSAAVRRSRGHSGIFDLRRSRGLSMVGRLPGGARIDQVAARAEVISSRLQTTYPDTNRNRRFTVAPLGEGRGLRVATRPMLRQLAGVVLMVLLVACVNVASLLLARAVSREREVAVRIAIGASRARLVRQWLTESVVLGILGSIGALLVTRVSTPLLHTFVIPEAVDLSVNGRVLGFTLVVGVGSGLLFGLAPVFQALRPDTTAALRDRGTVATGARATRSELLRGAFVILQIAVSLVLLVGAGLFLRTLKNAYSVELDYQVDQTLVASLNLEARGLLAQNYESGIALHVRAAGDPMSLVPAIRDAVRQVDSQLAVARPELLRDVLDRTLSRQRMMATLVGLFGAVALILAVLGLYGVMAHAATQRTPEIGIRLAMGAQPASIVALLLGQGLRLLGIGVAIGLSGALLGTRYIASQLFGVTATDPLTFAGGCVVLAIAGLTASVIPALRAMRVDPVIALRRT